MNTNLTSTSLPKPSKLRNPYFVDGVSQLTGELHQAGLIYPSDNQGWATTTLEGSPRSTNEFASQRLRPYWLEEGRPVALPEPDEDLIVRMLSVSMANRFLLNMVNSR